MWVGTRDAEAMKATLSWITKDAKPLIECPTSAVPRFAGLQTLKPPPEWAECIPPRTPPSGNARTRPLSRVP